MVLRHFCHSNVIQSCLSVMLFSVLIGASCECSWAYIFPFFWGGCGGRIPWPDSLSSGVCSSLLWTFRLISGSLDFWRPVLLALVLGHQSPCHIQQQAYIFPSLTCAPYVPTEVYLLALDIHCHIQFSLADIVQNWEKQSASVIPPVSSGISCLYRWLSSVFIQHQIAQTYRRLNKIIYRIRGLNIVVVSVSFFFFFFCREHQCNFFSWN